MPYYTPLRYPGGKRRLAPLVIRLLEANGLRDIEYAEPYAGSSAVALALLFGEYASVVHINDLSRPVYAFWHSVLNDVDGLCKRIERTSVTMREWHRQRAVYDDRSEADLNALGFATLFLNRTNRSGIIAGGVIGGKKQTGTWKIDARFNKPDIIQRIRRIARYRNRIRLYQLDALKFTLDVLPTIARSFAFYDPPYIDNGTDLYLNNYDIEGHRQLAVQVGQLPSPWIVTYDAAAVREQLYPTHRRLLFDLEYTAQDRYAGREVMFLADHLNIPTPWQNGRRVEISHPSDKVRVYGRMENVKPHPEMSEGHSAFERFQKAIKTIVAVPKDAVAGRPKAAKRKGRAKRKA